MTEDPRVQAAARQMHEVDTSQLGSTPWGGLDEEDQEMFLNYAYHGLAAADAAVGGVVPEHDRLADEYRAMSCHPHAEPTKVHRTVTVTFAEAQEWAALERKHYPRAEVWIEKRTVTPWERVADGGDRG